MPSEAPRRRQLGRRVPQTGLTGAPSRTSGPLLRGTLREERRWKSPRRSIAGRSAGRGSREPFRASRAQPSLSLNPPLPIDTSLLERQISSKITLLALFLRAPALPTLSSRLTWCCTGWLCWANADCVPHAGKACGRLCQRRSRRWRCTRTPNRDVGNERTKASG
jgi:hypothetical protein